MLHRDLDVDWMAVAIPIWRVQELFTDNTIVELAGYRPPIRDRPEYSDWLTIISKPFLLSIPNVAGRKMGIVKMLYERAGIIVRESGSDRCVIHGRQHMALEAIVGVLERLEDPEVEAVRI